MTEEEAKTKWCPMTNRQGTVQDNKCIALECMWWVEDEWLMEAIEGQQGHFLNTPQGHCGAIK